MDICDFSGDVPGAVEIRQLREFGQQLIVAIGFQVRKQPFPAIVGAAGKPEIRSGLKKDILSRKLDRAIYFRRLPGSDQIQ
jgi:hypothetical protein